MSNNINPAKLNKQLLRDFGQNKIKLSKVAINLILQLTPYIDRDGRIHLDMELLRKKTLFDICTIKGGLTELLETTYNGNELLRYENGYYISNFHVASKGETTYQKFLPIFLEPEFINLTLKQTRLLFYISTLNVKNQFTKVAIENLYNNSLHDERYGMFVNYGFRSMREDLFYLIDKGFVSLRLPGENTEIDKNDSNYKVRFNELCGFVDDRKLRTSKNHKLKHTIGLKLNPELYSQNAVANIAGKTEIVSLAERYHMYHEDIRRETFNYILEKKNTMVEEFGEVGLNIYRTALERYFAEKHEHILYYDLLSKAANHFTDFYLLEEIKKVLLCVLKSLTDDKEAISNTSYELSNIKIPLLVNYFITNSSDEHKVIMDEDIIMIEDAYELISGFTTDKAWNDLYTSIRSVYAIHTPRIKNNFIKECEKQGVENAEELFSQINSQELVRDLAKQSLLSKQQTLDEEVKKLKQIVLFFRKKNVPLIVESVVKPKPKKKEYVVNNDYLLKR